MVVATPLTMAFMLAVALSASDVVVVADDDDDGVASTRSRRARRGRGNALQLRKANIVCAMRGLRPGAGSRGGRREKGEGAGAGNRERERERERVSIGEQWKWKWWQFSQFYPLSNVPRHTYGTRSTEGRLGPDRTKAANRRGATGFVSWCRCEPEIAEWTRGGRALVVLVERVGCVGRWGLVGGGGCSDRVCACVGCLCWCVCNQSVVVAVLSESVECGVRVSEGVRVCVLCVCVCVCERECVRESV